MPYASPSHTKPNSGHQNSSFSGLLTLGLPSWSTEFLGFWPETRNYAISFTGSQVFGRVQPLAFLVLQFGHELLQDLSRFSHKKRKKIQSCQPILRIIPSHISIQISYWLCLSRAPGCTPSCLATTDLRGSQSLSSPITQTKSAQLNQTSSFCETFELENLENKFHDAIKK